MRSVLSFLTFTTLLVYANEATNLNIDDAFYEKEDNFKKLELDLEKIKN